MSASVPYLMKPGGSIVPLQLPDGAGFEAPPSRGETVIPLAGGGTTVTRRLNTKRAFILTWSSLDDPFSSTLLGLYSGLFDDPITANWVFVDPTVRNVLALDSSATGARSTAAIGWSASSGTVAASTTSGSAPAAAGAGVLSWSGMSAGGTVTIGASTATVDPMKAHPYLATEPVTASVYLMYPSAITATLSLQGYDATGAVISGARTNATVSVGSAWSRAAVNMPAGASGFGTAAFVRPVLSVSSALSNPLLLSAAQLEYAATGSAWQPGQGSPRVVITSPIGRAVQVVGYTDHTLTMAEC